jgi:hypothetical protein
MCESWSRRHAAGSSHYARWDQRGQHDHGFHIIGRFPFTTGSNRCLMAGARLVIAAPRSTAAVSSTRIGSVGVSSAVVCRDVPSPSLQ